MTETAAGTRMESAGDVSRRRFLTGSTAGLGVALVLPVGCAPSPSSPPSGGSGPFLHGVGSFEPDTSSVILWTRHAPVDGATQVSVRWEVSERPDLRDVLCAGLVDAASDRDWTVAPLVRGLRDGTTFYYRFTSEHGASVIGRTRTMPGGHVSRVRLGVASCARYWQGYFHTYRHMANRSDLDAVVHLGDYIYEGHVDATTELSDKDIGTFVRTQPNTGKRSLVSLGEYRARYKLYRSDPDLAELHRLHPFFCVWDDHEFRNDPGTDWKGEGPLPGVTWAEMTANALRAHREWLPSRASGTIGYGSVRLGDLAQLVLVDRQHKYLWRNDPPDPRYLDEVQFAWLERQVLECHAPWLILGSPGMFGSRSGSTTADGWGTSRERLFQAVDRSGVGGLVVVSGDLHQFQALDVVRDQSFYDPSTGRGSGAVEFMCGSVTSSGADGEVLDTAPPLWYRSKAHVGYGVLDVTRAAVQGDLFFYDADLRASPTLPAEGWLGWRSALGSNHLVAASAPRP